jgi:microcompartment protein CcmK/EutM
LGVANVLTTTAEASIEAAEQIFHHPKVALLCVTGGSAVAKAAAMSGKRVIAGGPGNPPVVVDETADLDHAAKCIIEGGGFDNNLLCIGEKEVFVVASVADAFMAAMRRAGAFQLERDAIERLTKAAFTFEGGGGGCARAHVKKDLVGKDPAVLGEAAGVRVPAGTNLLFGETEEDHPFVTEEQMMPFIPVVRVKCVGAAIEASVKAEHGYEHDALYSERGVGGIAGRGRTRIFQSYDCHSDGRRSDHPHDLYARASNGGGQRTTDHLAMFLARIEGTVVAAAKHPTLDGCRFLAALRLEADGSSAAEPLVVVDWLGAARGATVMVSTDGDIARAKLGNTTPARMVVVGIVDAVQTAGAKA